MALKRLKATAPIQDLTAALDEDGGLIVEGLFPADVIDRMARAVDEEKARYQPGAATQGLGEMGKFFTGNNTLRFSSLGKVSPAFFDMLDNETYAAITDHALLPACGTYWLNTGQAMLIGPGEPAQMLHRDCANWSFLCQSLWPTGPEVSIGAMIALDEVTEEMGATRVIPGSHKWEDWDKPGTPEETVPAEMSPGDALVYSSRVIHGGGENQTTDKWRKAMHLSFVAGWLTPEESHPLDYSDEDLQGVSNRVRGLLGHRSYDPGEHPGAGLWLRHVNKIEDMPRKAKA